MPKKETSKKHLNSTQVTNEHIKSIYLKERQLKTIIKDIELFDDEFTSILSDNCICDDIQRYITKNSDVDSLFNKIINHIKSIKIKTKDTIKPYINNDNYCIYLEEDFDGWKLFIHEYESFEDFKKNYMYSLNYEANCLKQKIKDIDQEMKKLNDKKAQLQDELKDKES